MISVVDTIEYVSILIIVSTVDNTGVFEECLTLAKAEVSYRKRAEQWLAKEYPGFKLCTLMIQGAA